MPKDDKTSTIVCPGKIYCMSRKDLDKSNNLQPDQSMFCVLKSYQHIPTCRQLRMIRLEWFPGLSAVLLVALFVSFGLP